MCGSEKVERALFAWPKWRSSLIHYWMSETEWPKSSLEVLSLENLRATASAALQELGLESQGNVMARYWICAVASDCNLEYESSFENIIIPLWFPKRFDYRLLRYGLGPFGTRRRLFSHAWLKAHVQMQDNRVYPPMLVTERDMELLRRQSHLGPAVYIPTGITRMLLPAGHELYSVIEGLNRRRREQNKIGRPPDYSDRLAVQCAMLNGQIGEIGIAKKFNLPTETPYFSKRSSTVRRLVKRGKQLIKTYRLDK